MDRYGRQDPENLATTAMLDALGQRVFPFDRHAVQIYPLIVVQRRTLGLATKPAHGQIAAIARSRGAAVATRNTTDFAHCGLDIINPWTA